MKAGIEKTLNLLKDTANEAAVPVLLSALDSASSEIQEGALRVAGTTQRIGSTRDHPSLEFAQRRVEVDRGKQPATDCDRCA